MKIQAISIGLFVSLLVTAVVPTIRHRLRYREWPLAFHRDADPFQRSIGVLLGLLLGAALVWAVLLSAVSWDLLGIWPTAAWATCAGWILVGLGTSLEIAGQRGMGPSFRIGIDTRPTALVERGAFALVRNPIFTGLIASTAGFVLLAPSPWSIMALAWIASLIALQVRLEEAHLVRTHGSGYLAYASNVGRFLPGLGKLCRAQ